MKASRTVQGAIGVAIVAGLVGGVVGAIILLPLGYDGARIGCVMGSLPVGLITLLIRYPRWEADL